MASTTTIDAALRAGESAHDRRVRDAAIGLGRQFRDTILRQSLEGARHTLDVLLVAAHGGHSPGTRVRVLSGPHRGGPATVIGAQWRHTGAPHAYAVRVDENFAVVIAGVDDIAVLDQPSQPEPALP